MFSETEPKNAEVNDKGMDSSIATLTSACSHVNLNRQRDDTQPVAGGDGIDAAVRQDFASSRSWPERNRR